MRKKTAQMDRFIEGLHKFIINHPQFRKATGQTHLLLHQPPQLQP